MKKSDLYVILAISFIVAIISFSVSSLLLGNTSNGGLTAPVVKPITTEFPQLGPDGKYFNEESINPTKDINIGETDNNEPF